MKFKISQNIEKLYNNSYISTKWLNISIYWYNFQQMKFFFTVLSFFALLCHKKTVINLLQKCSNDLSNQMTLVWFIALKVTGNEQSKCVTHRACFYSKWELKKNNCYFYNTLISNKFIIWEDKMYQIYMK